LVTGFTALLLGAAIAGDSGGRIETHARLGLSGCEPLPGGCTWLDLRDTAVIGVWAEEGFGALQARIAADLRLHPVPTLDTIEEAQILGRVQPLSLRMRDAWMDLPFAGDGGSLRLGLQTLSWGVADGIHVSDPVNPWNLENPLAMDAKLAVPAMRVKFGGSRWSVEGVLIPFHTGAVLPAAGFSLSPDAGTLMDVDAFSDNEVGDIQARIHSPEARLSNASAGLHASFSSARADMALTLYSGRDSLPQADGALLITGFQTNSDKVDFAVPLIYPRIQMAAVDARAELFADMSGWVEFAAVLPQATALTVSEVQMKALAQLGTIESVPDPLPSYTTQDGDPLLRWVAGLDRPFDRVHLSLQWLHGFPTERNAADLSDYGVLYTRFTLSDTLVFNLQSLFDLEGLLVMAKLTALVSDAAELSLEGAWARAPEGHSLEAFEGLSHVGLGAELAF
jgi:hypothetical protein